MKSPSLAVRLAPWVLAAGLLGAGFAMAQAEPTMNQVYAAAQAGKLDDAQVMIQQVLVSHPNSGKAHYVRAELYARQGKLDLARESLAKAEKYSPGLAFAKPEAVQALRAQLSGIAAVRPAPVANYSAAPAPVPKESSSWLLPLLLAGGVIVAGYFIFRRRVPATPAGGAAYSNNGGAIGGLNGPQTFGAGGVAQPQYPGQFPGQYPQGSYPQQQGTGLGGRIMGGVATGLAVGAGVMAAQAIGRNLMGGNDAHAGTTDAGHGNDLAQPDINRDMGGDNFGVSDSGSWDDGGGGGGDWDN